MDRRKVLIVMSKDELNKATDILRNLIEKKTKGIEEGEEGVSVRLPEGRSR